MTTTHHPSPPTTIRSTRPTRSPRPSTSRPSTPPHRLQRLVRNARPRIHHQTRAKAAKEAAIRKAAKKEQRKLAIATKYAETDAARAAMEGQSAAHQGKDNDDLLRHPPMSQEERERTQRRERARKAREERAKAAEMEEAKAKAAAARASMAKARPSRRPTRLCLRKEAEPLQGLCIGAGASGACGGRRASSSTRRPRRQRSAQKKAKAADKRRERWVRRRRGAGEVPSAPTLGAFIDLWGLAERSRPRERLGAAGTELVGQVVAKPPKWGDVRKFAQVLCWRAQLCRTVHRSRLAADLISPDPPGAVQPDRDQAEEQRIVNLARARRREPRFLRQDQSRWQQASMCKIPGGRPSSGVGAARATFPMSVVGECVP